MVWEAANIQHSESRGGSANVAHDDDNGNVRTARGDRITTTSTSQGGRRSAETVEAAIARLTKAYSASMACIGALRRASDALVVATGATESSHSHSSSNRIEEQLEQVTQVANAARFTLESAILMDPLVVEHAQLSQETFHSYYELIHAAASSTSATIASDGSSPRSWSFVKDPRSNPPSVSSAAHQSSIRDMAYASLVNYADLLWSACACGGDCSGSGADWRDQILPRLTILNHDINRNPSNDDGMSSESQKLKGLSCCWRGESAEDTKRLVLVALCDASELDGSDPTLWLKLAFVARELGKHELPSHPVGERRYRRLERHALEQGLLAVPPEVPPNRMIVRALEEFDSEPIPTEYPAVLAKPPETPELVLKLPRYSWSRLGRMLIKACREGTDYTQSTGAVERSTIVSFGSPLVALNLSPMLVLPSRLLGIICQFLENESIWKFEATCRALSVSIIAARVELERGAGKNTSADKNAPVLTEEEIKPSEPPPPPVEPSAQLPEGATTSRRSSEQAASRTSKRLRSQQITSGKLAEKSSRRRSVEYCFLSATLSCTSEDPEYISTLQQGLPPWPSLPNTAVSGGSSGHVPSQRPQLTRSPSSEKLGRQQMEARERVADASLSAFVARWSSKNSGPMDLMSKFLTHVALHVEDVFACDPGGVMALSSCFLDCLDVMSRRTGTFDELSQFPFGPQSIAITSNQQRVDIFAVNLLATELKLRRCERGALENMADHSISLGFISFAISELMASLPLLDEKNHGGGRDAVQWVGMKARTYWLAAVFNFLICRGCTTVALAREAEQEGYRCIEETLKCLELPPSGPSRIIKTIHLESPSRVGSHWSALSRESLTSFRDDLQASSVVSVAREKFLATLTTMGTEQDRSNGRCPESIRNSLESIGESLKSRYDLFKEGANDKLVELVDDFISLHGSALSNHPFPAHACDLESLKSRWNELWDIVLPDLSTTPFLPAASAPSIVSIFLASFSIQRSSHSNVLRLLSRLVSVAFSYHKALLPNRPTLHEADHDQMGGDGDSDDFSDGDSLAYSSDDQSTMGHNPHRGSKGPQMSKPRLCIRLMQLFTEKIAEISYLSLDHVQTTEFAESEDCQEAIRCCLLVCSDLYQPSDHDSRESGDLLDIEIFSSVKLLVHSLRRRLDSGTKKQIERLYLHGLCRVIITQRKVFSSTLRFRKGGRAARSAHQKRCKTRAEFVASVSVEIACLLSQNLSRVREGHLEPSELLVSSGGECLDCGAASSKASELVSLCGSLLWFWKYVVGFDVMDDRRSPSTLGSRSDNRIGNSFDRPIVDQLRVPIASAIIGLSGAAAHTRRSGNGSDNFLETPTIGNLCLSEFYDTDASANELSSDDESEKAANRSELLRILCHGVHSVSLIFENVSEKEATSLIHESERPLLPLVVARVLNHFADTLLSQFGPHKGRHAARKNLFEIEYPFRARRIGRILDESLYKAYKCLHGFTLLSAQPITTNDESAAKKSAPESTLAAAQLYRCIERAYGSGRKSPPRSALECVALALPTLPVTEKSKAIRDFLFLASESYFDSNDIVTLVTEAANWESRFSPIHDFLTPQRDSADDDVDEIFIVQRGVCHQLAELPLPPIVSDVDSKGSDDDRATSIRTEEELMKKINSIVDDLCSGDSLDYDGWHRAAQCTMMKADMIADRLGLSKGFARNTNFRIPEHRPPSTHKITLSRLKTEQEQEFQLQREGWIPYLGDSLAAYVQYHWCSFSSLESCAAVVGQDVLRAAADQESALEHESHVNDCKATFGVQVWKEIEWLKEKGNDVLWQQAWGSIFVAALRKITFRCECLALYSLFKRSLELSDSSNRVSEICESLGIALYSELMGSQIYGYPMKIMTDHEKRQIAEAARACFRRAADSITGGPGEGRLAWDLLFMIGKCFEKVAGTFRQEAFAPDTTVEEGAAKSVRRYEFYMTQALESYAVSLQQARALEEDKDFIVEQAGGSAHGAKEVFYRLHATRLKCLIGAVCNPESEIQQAEVEALALTEMNWFLESANGSSDAKSVRDRVWDVFSDAVAALAQCKLDQPFFHRSVFRHAQALMWAPVLSDPVSGRVEGSLGNVPISKGYRIRGLNSGTSVASSAQVIMASLFEKKRSQLCAVWVTTANVPSPFQVLNNTVRKYDSLRGKYISAYIETLELSRSINQLEVLLQWSSSCRRDLPSYFQASASAKGLNPERPHTRDNLLIKGRSVASYGFLRTIKRQANSAIANIILREFSSASARSNQDAKASETRTRTAYACFLRLNCTIEELERSNAWKYGNVPEAEAACQAYLALEGSQYGLDDAAVTNDWSGGSRKSSVLRKALAKFREIFPSITSSFYTKKASSKPRKAKVSDNDKLLSPTRSKRKERQDAVPDVASRRMSFTVSVPNDLKAGDHFHTTVKVGEQFKKVTLTVPPGNPQTLKFSLDIPDSETTNNSDEPASKRVHQESTPSSL